MTPFLWTSVRVALRAVLLTIAILTTAHAQRLTDGAGPGHAARAAAPILNQGDSVWHEQEMLAFALVHNSGLSASRMRIEAAQARATRAGAWPAPTISFEFYNTPITSFNPLQDGLENDYALQQMIPLSGMPGLMRDMATAQSRMERSVVHVKARDLLRDLRSDIAMLQSARKRLRINAENQQLLEQILRSIESAYAVGRAGQADVMRTRVERELSISDRLTIEAEIKTSTAMVNARLNRAADTPIPEIVQDEIRTLTDPQALDAASPHERSELQMMTAEADMVRAQATLADRAWVPELMLRGMYKQMTMGMPDSWALMIGFSIPFAPWAQPAITGARQEAEAQRREVELRTEEMRLMIGMERSEALSKAAALAERLRRYGSDVLPASTQAVSTAFAAFSGGGGNFTTLIDAARMHTMLRMEEAMLEAEFRAAYARLRWAAGTDEEEVQK